MAIVRCTELYEKTISNMVECKSRDTYLMVLTTYGKYETKDNVDFMVYVPRVDEHFAAKPGCDPAAAAGVLRQRCKGFGRG